MFNQQQQQHQQQHEQQQEKKERRETSGILTSCYVRAAVCESGLCCVRVRSFKRQLTPFAAL